MANTIDAEVVPEGVDPVTGEVSEETPIKVQSAIIPYQGIATSIWKPETVEALLAPVDENDVEIRPDGLIYVPEIKYRRKLQQAFGPGVWSLLPMEIRVESGDKMLYYRGALFVAGKFVSEAIGEAAYYPNNDRMSYGTAAESAKSNCLMRCSKDLGIYSECWDPQFIERWKATYAREVWCSNVGTGGGDRGKKRKMWRKKSAPPIDMYPWKEDGDGQQQPGTRQQSNHQLPAGQPAQQAPAQHQAQAPQNGDKGPTITFRQVKRFQAIAHDRGWTPAEVAGLLRANGYENPDAIGRNDYEKLCNDLEDVELLTMIRSNKQATPAPEGLAGAKRDRQPSAAEQENRIYPGGCSYLQLQRLHTIAGEMGWTDEWVRWHLQSYGHDSSKDLTPAEYERFCNDLENPVLLTEYQNLNPKPAAA